MTFSRFGFAWGVVGLALVGLVRCVSRSGAGDRFNDSARLAAPTLTATPSDPDHFSFAFVGDLHISRGDTSRVSQILSSAQAEGDAFVVLLGDIVDGGARSDVEAVHQAVTAAGWDGKVLYVVGNHDIFSDGWSAFRDLNGPSHFSLDFGHSRLIAFDTADGGLSDVERSWLESQVSRPAPAHVFLLSHYLPIVPGERTYLKLADEAEARHLMKLATSHGVGAWLGGHYHSFVTGTAAGVQYVVAGGGGGRRMQPVTGYFFVQMVVDGASIRSVLHMLP